VPTYNHHQNTDIGVYLFDFTFLIITNRLAQRQSAGLASQGSQVLISLLTKTFFFPKIILKIYTEDFENVKLYFFEKKNWKKKYINRRFFWRSEKKGSWKLIFNMRIIHAAPSVGRNNKVDIQYSKAIFKIFKSDLQKDIFSR
jgi:hypothetical protein